MKKAIVFDSSTVILLAKISLLREVTTGIKCTVTDIVVQECTRKDTDDAKIIKKLVEEKLIETVNAKKAELAKVKSDFGIEDGEASSLALALGEKCMLATDDKPTMKACTVLNVDLTTAVHFVVRACKRGPIAKELALEKLKSLEKYGRYSPRILEDAKKRLEGD